MRLYFVVDVVGWYNLSWLSIHNNISLNCQNLAPNNLIQDKHWCKQEMFFVNKHSDVGDLMLGNDSEAGSPRYVYKEILFWFPLE